MFRQICKKINKYQCSLFNYIFQLFIFVIYGKINIFLNSKHYKFDLGQDTTYDVRVSYLEIYNEEIR